MFYVYVLYSQTKKKRYVGQTQELGRRLAEHNAGLSRYTSGKGPWELIFCEELPTRSTAIKRERFLKTGKGREFLDRLLT